MKLKCLDEGERKIFFQWGGWLGSKADVGVNVTREGERKMLLLGKRAGVSETNLLRMDMGALTSSTATGKGTNPSREGLQ